MEFDPASLRKQFHALARQIEEKEADIAPLRAEYEAMREEQNALLDQIRVSQAAIRKEEQPLAEMKRQQAAIARILGNKVGSPE
jgi:predicted  nucleic acid-binding Zn-ribbon protein